MNDALPIGQLLKQWRQRRRLSQLDFATEAEISSKHLSFLETGRSKPSREMVLKLAEILEVPLRERNTMLVAAGFAPVFVERPLDDPALGAARKAVDLVLKGHEPYPALAIDRHWTMLAANGSVALLLVGLPEFLLQPPINVLRLSLHPQGLAPRIVNLTQWRAHLLARLRHQVEVSADTTLMALLEELTEFPAPARTGREVPIETHAVAIPFQLDMQGTVLSFISMTTVFGTPLDITLAELALETFFPADAATANVLRSLAGSAQGTH